MILPTAPPLSSYAMVGWDPRPWHEPRPAFQLATAGEWKDDLCELRSLLLQASAGAFGVPKGDGTVQHMFHIYSWNEFGEGGYAAPSQGLNYSRLETLLSVFAASPSVCSSEPWRPGTDTVLAHATPRGYGATLVNTNAPVLRWNTTVNTSGLFTYRVVVSEQARRDTSPPLQVWDSGWVYQRNIPFPGLATLEGGRLVASRAYRYDVFEYNLPSGAALGSLRASSPVYTGYFHTVARSRVYWTECARVALHLRVSLEAMGVTQICLCGIPAVWCLRCLS
jgi:hypothetical protein